jgi:hypothetical protein
MYNKDKYCIPYTRAYLFDKPLLVLQKMQQSSMDSWVKSVKEAVATRQCREELHNELSRMIMGRFLAMGRGIPKSGSNNQRKCRQLKLMTSTPKQARRKDEGHDTSVSSVDSTDILHPIWTRKTSDGKKSKTQTTSGTPKATLHTGRSAKIQVNNPKARKIKKRSVVKKSPPMKSITLHQFGFSHIPKAGSHEGILYVQRTQEAEKTEFSGTCVSTVP